MLVRREGKEKQESMTSGTSFQFISRSQEVILTSKRQSLTQQCLYSLFLFVI
ncbi:hypothetical protein V6Z11_A04G089800 [Gossypium hirsutum]